MYRQGFIDIIYDKTGLIKLDKTIDMGYFIVTKCSINNVVIVCNLTQEAMGNVQERSRRWLAIEDRVKRGFCSKSDKPVKNLKKTQSR